MTKKNVSLERQKVRDRYEPVIANMRGQRDDLVTEIEHLKLKKIFVDQHINSFNTLYEKYFKTIDLADKNLREKNSLKGNYMTDVKENMHLILEQGWRANRIIEDCELRMKDGQTKLNDRIDELQSQLSSTMTLISAEISLMNATLALIN
ncbi:hypothetical protein [Enterococcus plantarum]|uniref:hypothetical protein n=1 Tax=Enterococcus plantarum TaxID=1077675 RepID=UPI001A909631|nr:hypothetical protein [Enterococcus plantarum]MBO0424121.1 hypothetical protein [Enterococcus plantarum]